MSTTTDVRLLMPVKELLERAGLSEAGFRWLRQSGQGPEMIRVGRRLYVEPEVAEKWLAARFIAE